MQEEITPLVIFQANLETSHRDTKKKVNRKRVEKIWTTFCATGGYEVQQTTKGGPKDLEQNELSLLELLKKNRP